MTSLEQQLAEAARVVAAGGVIAYPTEAVYGLGCDPHRADAVRRVLDLKQRDAGKGLILVAAERAQIDSFIRPPAAALERRLAETWPGPTTWILPARTGIADILTGGTGRIAVRLSAFSTLRQLCSACGCALVSTSANPSGQPPATSADRVRAYFPAGVDLVIDAPTGGETQPSRIFDGDSLERLR